MKRFFKNCVLSLLIALLTWILIALGLQAKAFIPAPLPSSQGPAQLYSNQTNDNLSLLFSEAISRAKRSIVLAVYSLTDQEMIKSLKEASNEGVDLHIVCDAEASPGISHRLPEAHLTKRSGTGLMHQKILVIDGFEVWLSSANMTYNSLHVHDNLVAGVKNKELAALLIARIKSMDSEGGYTPLLHQTIEAGGQSVELWMLPDDNEALSRLKYLLRTAEKSIKVAMFTWTRQDFANELIAAGLRGIKVEVIIDRYSGKGASKKVVQLLDKGGITPQLSTGNKLLHHKFALIDDSTLVHGSANWTLAAFQENDDYFIVITPLNEQQKKKMAAVWNALKKESAP